MRIADPTGEHTREQNIRPPEGRLSVSQRGDDQATVSAVPFYFRRCPTKPSPNKPRSSIAQIDGSGTDWVNVSSEPIS